MNAKKFIEGIDLAIEALSLMKDAMCETETAATPTTAPTKEALDTMSYSDFKKYAASLGVKCTGTRDEIMKRIELALGGFDGEDAPAADPTPAPKEEAPEKAITSARKKVGKKSEAEEEKPPKSDKPNGGKFSHVRKPVEEEKDEFDEKAEAIVADTDFEDIVDALKDAGVKGVTKKNVTEKLAAALRDGLIETEDEDGEDADESAEDSSEDAQFNSESYFPKYDPEGYNDPENMTDERKAAVLDMVDDLCDKYSNGGLSDDDIQSFLEENATQDELDALGDDPDVDNMFALYLELNKRFIDNEGEKHDGGEDPYEVGEHDFCCGHKLKFVKKTKRYVCEHCGSEYEAD